MRIKIYSTEQKHFYFFVVYIYKISLNYNPFISHSNWHYAYLKFMQKFLKQKNTRKGAFFDYNLQIQESLNIISLFSQT